MRKTQAQPPLSDGSEVSWKQPSNTEEGIIFENPWVGSKSIHKKEGDKAGVLVDKNKRPKASGPNWKRACKNNGPRWSILGETCLE